MKVRVEDHARRCIVLWRRRLCRRTALRIPSRIQQLSGRRLNLRILLAVTLLPLSPRRMLAIRLLQHLSGYALELGADTAHALDTSTTLVVVEHVQEVDN